MSADDLQSKNNSLNNLPNPADTSTIHIPRGPVQEDKQKAEGFVPAASVAAGKENHHMGDGLSDSAAPDGNDPEAMLAYQNLERHKREKKKKRIIRGAIVGAVVLALAGFGIHNLFGKQNNESEETLATSYAYRGDLIDSVSSSGATRPVDSVVVTPEVDGVIESLKVSEGQQVKEGDLLFTIKNDELDKNVRTAELALRTAQNGVNSAQKELDEARSGRSSLASVDTDMSADTSQLATQGDGTSTTQAFENTVASGTGIPLNKTAVLSAFIPIHQTDGPVVDATAVEAARIALENAQIELESAQEALEVAQSQAAKREVKAPKSGTIIAMRAVEGAAVGGSGDGTSGGNSLITIADLSKMRVTVQVNEIDISKIKQDQKATVTFSALPNVELEGKVTKIAAVSGTGEDESYGDGGIVTYPVDILIEKPDPNLKPGMTASVEIISQHVEDVLIVPITSLQDMEDGTGYVTVVDNPEDQSTIHEVPVKIIAKSTSDAAIEPTVEGSITEDTLVVLGGSSSGDGMDAGYEETVYED